MLTQIVVLAVVLAALGGCVWMVRFISRAPSVPSPAASARKTETNQAALIATLDHRVRDGLGRVRDPGLQMALGGRYKVSHALPSAEQRLSLQEILIDLDRLPTESPSARGTRSADTRDPSLVPRTPVSAATPESLEPLELIDLAPSLRDGWLARQTLALLRERVMAILGGSATEALWRKVGSLPESDGAWQTAADEGTLAVWVTRMVDLSREGVGPERFRSLMEQSARDLGQRFPLACFPKLLATFPDGYLTAEKSQASLRESLWHDFLQSQRSLHDAQEQLIAREKMAALGQLVAGVAHEINTPLGIALTALSHLHVKLREFSGLYKQGQVKKSQLQELLDEGEEATRLALENLRRGATLVASFKKVAVDQTSEERRKVSLRAYLDEVLESLKPMLRGTKLGLEVDLPDITVDTYPGALSQVLTNLVQNSVVHGYEPGQPGRLCLRATEANNLVTLTYEDDGKGIPAEVIGRVFEPFFTTKRGAGGSGLGMHVVHNLVSQVLQGDITVQSEYGHGARFTVRFPVTLGDPA